MPTTMEGLTQLGSDLRDLMANLLGYRTELQALKDSTAAGATTIIQQFNARPLNADYHLDPLNGNDANDGSTYAKAKRTIDGILSTATGTQGVNVFAYGDFVWSGRYVRTYNLYLYGVQVAATPNGRAPARRKLTFLGRATNSPSDTLGIMSAGIIFDAGNFFTDSIDIALPDVPADVTLRPHVMSSLAMFGNLVSPTITVIGSAAAALFGSFNAGRLTITINPTLGAGAAGHVFNGVAAGANPNAFWSYSTNLTSA